MTAEQFDALHEDMLALCRVARNCWCKTCLAGLMQRTVWPTRVVTELAWHSLFIQNLLIEPETPELDGFDPDFVITEFPRL